MERDWNDFKGMYGNKEGARAAFEKVCGALLRNKYPNRAYEVEVSNGDDGIDIFVGNGIFDKSLEVFQCKFFIDGFFSSQKQQMKSSFDSIINNDKYSVKKWYIALPITLNKEQHKWFDKWKLERSKEHAIDPGNIILWDGDYLLDQLKESGLYNTWFKIEDSNKIKEIHEYILNKDDKTLKIKGDNEIKGLSEHLNRTSSFIPSETRLDFTKVLAELAQNATQHGGGNFISVCSNNGQVELKYDGKRFNSLDFVVEEYHGLGIRSLKCFLEIYKDSVECSYKYDKSNILTFKFLDNLLPHQTDNPCFIFTSHSIHSLSSDVFRAINHDCEEVEIDLISTHMHFSNLHILINDCVAKTRKFNTKFKFIIGDRAMNKHMVSHLDSRFSSEDLSRVEWVFK
ncbi:hypothetical protein [Shewanella halifaxensis]|uniref:hypothetical protein n=1 Tax=Shewanella halifaxensis TaxID=271098 RepID=UPI000318229C|nr:hypothetical protein [Shewanella halifaxensis]